MHVRSCCFAFKPTFFYFLLAILVIEFFSPEQYVKVSERIHAGEHVPPVTLCNF